MSRALDSILKPAIRLKDSHAICPKPGLFPSILIEKYRHAIHLIFKRTVSLNEGRGAIFFPSPQLLVNHSSIFSSQQIVIYATLKARLQSTQGIVLSLASFRVPLKRDFKLQRFRSDFSPEGIPITRSHLADFHRFLWAFSFSSSKISSLSVK
ncbi:hypothetical protein AVEN_147341-1 [Araneus ventricosus]|uniref:Uncharacterized protein n=1 Tax=Araneus ventricosus TaxID=182803 RepID=A0A4Y2MV72_ARAVE|nr:hypothetical protein AVEN_7479-1 [Araneus ventricosus]GBN30472.1 hypothetical protein AVEN_103730-1 [Araneus ventricosus]GBN30678.1 hypothetical protein AVEN_147341-1 [Araneus ventricosus]